MGGPDPETKAESTDDKQSSQKPSPAPKKERRGNPTFICGPYYEKLEKCLKSKARVLKREGDNLRDWFDGMSRSEFCKTVKPALASIGKLPTDRTLHDSGRKIVAKIENG